MADRERVDRLYVHAAELLSLTGGAAQGARRMAGDADPGLGLIEDGAMAVRDGRVVAVGRTDELNRRFVAADDLDLSGYVVVPGFVDCHTHPVFAATRHEEFHQRCAGADYMAIAQAGGGILSSMRAVREADEASLRERVCAHLDGFLRLGTTTIEGKSGYGLSTEAELKSLRVLTDVASRHPLTVSRTFLGAHEFPPEYRDDRERYVQLVADEMLPAVARERLAESADVFAEPGVFDREQSRRVLAAAQAVGLRLRVHADELQPMGGAELAVELGADSADHLGRVSLGGIAALAGSSTTAVLLPGTTFFLDKPFRAPARSLIDAGAAVALASDFNPGSCHLQSMPLVISLGCIQLKMTPAECLVATTINPAASLHLDHEVGTLHPGKRADFAALELSTWRELGYALGGNPVVMTVKDGVPVSIRTAGEGGLRVTVAEPLYECVPNFSEGRDEQVVQALAAALVGGGARLLDAGRDADHHRSVLTVVGTFKQLVAGVVAAAAEAVRAIDLRHHRGVHRRMGALDVCPFVPLPGATMADAVVLARAVGKRLGTELQLPVFLYGEAAVVEARRVMSTIRNLQFEGLASRIGHEVRYAPDYGPALLHPTAGAVAVGARPFLIAFNVQLASADVALARTIAAKVRASNGGLPAVQAMGFLLEGPKLAQVSMNLLDWRQTSVQRAFQRVAELAAAAGVEVASSELIGLAPAAALDAAVAAAVRLPAFDPAWHTVEGRLRAVS